MPTPSMRTSRQNGFTLIELMVVVAIISILSMIALPQYQRFSAKAKLTAALAELTIGKAKAEVMVIENFRGGALDAADFGLPLQSKRCDRFEIWGQSGTYSLTCYLKQDRTYGTGSLTLYRGGHPQTWSCSAYLNDQSLLPEPCRRRN